MGKTDKQQLTLYLPGDLHKALKLRAVEEGTSMTVLLEGMIRRYLATKRRRRGGRKHGTE